MHTLQNNYLNIQIQRYIKLWSKEKLMGKGMAKWWDRRWRLVIIAILLPILLVPIINIFLFPETPLTESLLYGSLFTFLVLWALKILGLIEFWGLRFVILVTGFVALFSLLLIFVFIKAFLGL